MTDNTPTPGSPHTDTRKASGSTDDLSPSFFSFEPGDDETPLNLRDAVLSGDYRSILVAQRLELAESIPVEKGPAKAALHRQLTLVAQEIQRLELLTDDQEEPAVKDEPFDPMSI